MNFPEKLKRLRVKNEYSQEQLAEMLNVSRQAITKWESGKGMPDISNVKAIAELFDITLDSLLDDAEELEETDEYFCWKICFAMAMVGLTVGWLLTTAVDAAINIGAFGIGGGIIGYALGYIILQVSSKFKG